MITYTLYTRYPIVAPRAWPAALHSSAFRPSASREQRYIAYKVFCIQSFGGECCMYAIYICSRGHSASARPSARDDMVSCIQG